MPKQTWKKHVSNLRKTNFQTKNGDIGKEKKVRFFFV